MMAFLKKKWMELCRTGRLLILLLIFILFGILNPALAKLTPWLMETLSESLCGYRSCYDCCYGRRHDFMGTVL